MHYEDYIDIRRMMRDVMRDFREMSYHDPKIHTTLKPMRLRAEGFTRRTIRRHRAQLHVRSPTKKNISHLMMARWLRAETLLFWSVMGNPSAQGETIAAPFT